MSLDFRVRAVRRCQGKACCRDAGYSSTDVLRAGGWRIYDGPSLTGKELHYLFCPWCAGTTDRPDPDTGWTVGCDSCDWVYEPEWDETPLTEADAKQVERDHQCEPQTWRKPPKVTHASLRPNNLSLLEPAGAS